MNIALIGYGKMGKTIEKIATQRGHQISTIIDQDKAINIDPQSNDVAIEFTQPSAAFDNISYCLKNQLPIVSGTTGWLDRQEEIHAICQQHQGTFLYASNFSIGVNVFFELADTLAKLMKGYPNYQPSIKEVHHVQKKDAPSGTAITIAEHLLRHLDYSDWTLNPTTTQDKSLPITSERLPDVPGTHEIAFRSEVDTIELIHTAHSREGFALGAVMAAEFLQDKTGIFGMRDLLGF